MGAHYGGWRDLSRMKGELFPPTQPGGRTGCPGAPSPWSTPVGALDPTAPQPWVLPLLPLPLQALALLRSHCFCHTTLTIRVRALRSRGQGAGQKSCSTAISDESGPSAPKDERHLPCPTPGCHPPMTDCRSGGPGSCPSSAVISLRRLTYHFPLLPRRPLSDRRGHHLHLH